jgi:DNA-binding CsgD family transcriptional regulator
MRPRGGGLTRLDDALLLRLVDEVYAAALDPTRWPGFMSALSGVLRGPGIFFLQDTSNAQADVFEYSEFDDTFIKSYAAFYATRNPWLPRIDASAGSGTVVTSESLLDPGGYEATEFYNDWMRPQGQYHMIGGIVLKERTVGTNISFVRSRRGGPFTDDEIHLYRQLLPHINRAVDLHRRLAVLALQREAGLAALDALDLGALLVDAGARMLFANRVAARLIGDGLVLRAGVVSATRPAETGQLHRLIAEAARVGARQFARPGGSLAVSRRAGPPVAVLVCPMRLGDARFALDVPSALVFLAEPERAAPPDERIAQLVYGLSAAETRLLRDLLAGKTLDEAAAIGRVSLNTVKFHLKQLFAKTGTRRQSDLLRLILRHPLVGVTRAEQR